MLPLNQLIKDISKIDVRDICSAWSWLLEDQKQVVLVSCTGDLFLLGINDEINWLDCGAGQLTRLADNIEEFKKLLKDYDNVEEWFLASIVEDLYEAGVTLKENEVFSYKLLPLLGGLYSAENMEPADMSVHFSLSGQICRQVKDLPDGTSISSLRIE